MPSSDKYRAQRALEAIRGVLTHLRHVDFDYYESRDVLDLSDAWRGLSEAEHALKCALGFKMGDEIEWRQDA